MAPRRFITFEGGEGAGKSTQVELLATALRRRGLRVCATREPGGSPGAEAIRELLVTGPADRWDALGEALLHSAARRDHLRCLVHPRLAAGDWVLCDRFADSTLAYQGYGHGLDRAAIDALHALVVGAFRPDLTLILDLPVARGLKRAKARGAGEDRYENFDRAFHERLRAGFQEIARQDPERCRLIDASGGIKTVHGLVRAQVTERLGISFP